MQCLYSTILTYIVTTLDLQRRWDLSKLAALRHQSHPLEPEDTVEFIGRETACDVISKVAASNFTNRASEDHAGHTFLVASGHIRSGKTRAGIETPRLVNEMCSKISLASPEINFVNAVYLTIDFLNDARFNPQFDVKDMDVSLALGSRLMNAFYNETVLKEIRHDVALHHIITTILADGVTNSNTVVPLVIHFDEHGKFIKAMDKERKEPVGKDYFEQMLCMIGSAATSQALPLSALRSKGLYFIVGITTGTSFKDANFSTLSGYGVQKIPLPVLDGPNTKRLAMSMLRLRWPKWSDEQLDEILSDSLFRIALADTAGLPGLIRFLCDTNVAGSYVEYLHFRVIGYAATQDWSHRWGSLTSIALARPRLVEASIIEDTYTLRDALDSGTVLYDEIEHEIRLVPVLLASYNAEYPTFDSLVLKVISRASHWTWQDFEKSHALYLSATMMALKKEEGRFNDLKLKNFLRHVRPQDNVHLDYGLVLSSEVEFNGIMFETDTKQFILKEYGKKRKRHNVRTDYKDSLVHAAKGTPLIDAYLNLELVNNDPSCLGLKVPTTLFIQYKHTSIDTGALHIKVSAMNAHTEKLSKTLEEQGWDTKTQNWLILWVSNRPILEDVIPHSRLLWVGRDNLEQHAPLIGRRGLVIN
jgi:hypothetical protein